MMLLDNLQQHYTPYTWGMIAPLFTTAHYYQLAGQPQEDEEEESPVDQAAPPRPAVSAGKTRWAGLPAPPKGKMGIR